MSADSLSRSPVRSTSPRTESLQEGLTNALKHARATKAELALDYRPGELQIDVRDDGVGAAETDGLGHGLLGIRERVKIYGGEMTAGPAPERRVCPHRPPADRTDGEP